MRMPCMILVVAITMSTPAIAFAQEISTDGSAAAIRKVVSGKTCVGEDTLNFGESVVGAPAKFERSGRPEGAYAVGYGTILIRRDQDLHGHLASVSVPNGTLYMSAGTYRCGPPVPAFADREP